MKFPPGRESEAATPYCYRIDNSGHHHWNCAGGILYRKGLGRSPEDDNVWIESYELRDQFRQAFGAVAG